MFVRPLCNWLFGFVAVLFVSADLADCSAATPDWPAWQGPHGNGHSADQQVPLRWTESENIHWKAAVPGRGHSSPVVYQHRIFLTTADESTQKQSILAYDRDTGNPLWATLAHEGSFAKRHGKNSHASATPACDGRYVYAVFLNGDGLYVTATDLEGKIVWQANAGTFTSEHGYGSSPVLYKSLLIVNGDSLRNSFVAALDRSTGELVWSTQTKTTGRHGGYATPIVRRLAGRDQLLLMGIGNTSSYDPSTGRQLWTCRGPSEVNACTVATHGDLVIASGGYPEKEILAIRADGRGDVTHSHVVWRVKRGVTYVPTPLVHDGHLYVINDSGIASCIDADTGKAIWQERLRGNFSASPTLAGGHLFVPDEQGNTFVLRVGPEFEVVARNDLRDGGFASPTICGSRIYLRTNHWLYCIAESGAE